MYRREIYILVAPNPCGEGWVTTEVTPETARTATSILSSCWLTRHYRGIEVASGDTPEEAVAQLFKSRGAKAKAA